MMNCQEKIINVYDDKSDCCRQTIASLFKGIMGTLGSFGFYTMVVILFIVCLTVASLVALPLLLAAFVVTRFLQFIYACSYVYDKGTQLKVFIKLKLLIRTWLYIDTLYLTIMLVILYGVTYVSRIGLNHVIVLRYPIKHWIETYFIIFAIYTLSYFFSIVCKRFVMFCIPFEYHTFKSGSYVVSDTVHEITDCFILLLFVEHVVMMRAHFLKEYKVLGFYHYHTLFNVLVLLLVSHDLIGLSIHMLVRWVHELVTYSGTKESSFRYSISKTMWGRKSVVYWVNGLKPSIMLTFTSLVLLFMWVTYFRAQPVKHEHDSTRAKKVLRIGTWTCLCLFVFSILWLIKACILLVLEDRMVYSRFYSKIYKGGKKLFVLGVIGRRKHDFLKLRYDGLLRSSSKQKESSHATDQETEDDHNNCGYAIKNFFNFTNGFFSLSTKKQGVVSCLMISIFPILLTGEDNRYQLQTDPEDMWFEREPSKAEKSNNQVKKLSIQRKKRAKAELLTRTGDEDSATLYDLQKMVQHFLIAKKNLLQDNYISDILKGLKEDHDNGLIKYKTLKKLFVGDGKVAKYDKAAWEYFQNNVLDIDLSSHLEPGDEDPISDEKLKTWLESTRKQCLFLANTLSSAREIVGCLNRIISVLLIVVVLILWLLLTRLTTKDLIVLIGSPVIALNFMFGDTSKTFFQGFVFVYSLRPFDVGDLCVIDGIMLEVITIGVWKTIFTKVETLETVVYPNSDLVGKTITNHKTEFDWNDHVELYVHSTKREKINSLKQRIQEELNDSSKYESTPGGIIEVMENTTENKIKIVIEFRHNANLQKKSMTYYECLREKRKLRSEFVEKFVIEDKVEDHENNYE